MTPTGRRVTGPAADLVELDSEKGLKHTAVVFHPEWRDHPSLDQALQSVMPFLEDPGVGGILPIATHARDEGAFVYPSGTVVSLAEVFRVCAEMGQPGGVKAALELCYLAGETLIEAAGVARQQSRLRGHGALSPWRIALKADGQIAILGYGLPQVELLNYVRDQGRGVKEDSFRYAPPERFDGSGEDISSDLFSLVLIATELMVGRPVYDGVLADVRQKATRGEAVRQLYQWRDRMPDPVREVLVRALKPDRDSRYRDPAELVFAVHDLLASSDAEGPSLADVARRARLVLKQGRAVMGGSTGDMSAEELAELALTVDGDPAQGLPSTRLRRPDPEPAPADTELADLPRWSKVSRGQNPDLVRTTDLSGPATDLRERLRQASRRTAEPAPAPAAEESARDRLRRRLKEKGGGEPEPARPAVVTPAAAPSVASVPSASRLVASRASTPAPAPVAEPVPEPPPAMAAPTPAPPPVQAAPARPRVPVAPPPPLPKPAEPPPPEIPIEQPAGLELPSAPPGEEVVPVTPLPRAPEVDPPSPDAPEDPAPQIGPRGGAPPDAREDLPPPSPVPAQGGAPPVQRSTAPTAAPATTRAQPTSDGQRAAVELLERMRRSAPPRPKLPDPASAPAQSPARASAPQEHRLDLLVEGAVRSASVPPGVSLAEAAARLATEAGLPTDLAGSLEGWWRLEQDGRRWPGTEGVGVLDPQKPVNLAFVANEVRPMTIEVRGLADPIRFRAPVGTAVPVRSLLEHLRRFLALPPADWVLQVDGQALAPLQILDEVGAGDGTTLVVSR